MAETNQDFATRWFHNVWNMRRREAIAEMLAPDALIHEAGLTLRGPEGFYSFFDRMQSAFSQIHVTVEDTITQGDKICVRWSCAMKHTGDGLGMAPTGKALETTGIAIIRVSRDRAIEAWQNWDMLGLMQQIQGNELAATYVGARA
jgi:predicted ester cyclase